MARQLEDMTELTKMGKQWLAGSETAGKQLAQRVFSSHELISFYRFEAQKMLGSTEEDFLHELYISVWPANAKKPGYINSRFGFYRWLKQRITWMLQDEGRKRAREVKQHEKLVEQQHKERCTRQLDTVFDIESEQAQAVVPLLEKLRSNWPLGVEAFSIRQRLGVGEETSLLELLGLNPQFRNATASDVKRELKVVSKYCFDELDNDSRFEFD